MSIYSTHMHTRPLCARTCSNCSNTRQSSFPLEAHILVGVGRERNIINILYPKVISAMGENGGGTDGIVCKVKELFEQASLRS